MNKETSIEEITEDIKIEDNDTYTEEDEHNNKAFVVEATKGINIISDVEENVFVKIDMDNLVQLPNAANSLDHFHRFFGIVSFYKNIFSSSFLIHKFKKLKFYIVVEVNKDDLHPAVKKALQHKDIVIFQKGKPINEEEVLKKIKTTFNLKPKK